MLDSSFFQVAILVFEMLGVVTLVAGFALALALAIRALARGEGGAQAFQTLRVTIGGSILLGLEIFVAADIIRTISAPTFEEAGVLALIVAIRTVLSISIQIEIEGVVPWKRALVTSGAEVVAREIAREPARESAPGTAEESVRDAGQHP